MTLTVRRCTPADRPAIERLNARLAQGGTAHRAYEEPPAATQSGASRRRVFLAVDNSEVRGGAELVEQRFRIAGQTTEAGWLKYPVAESLVDARYNGVPVSLVRHLVEEQPRLMALGLGGHTGPLARLLKALGWSGMAIPFYFLPLRPGRVLRRLTYARSTAARRALLNGLAWSGLGGAAFGLASLGRSLLAAGRARDVTGEMVDTFSGWADDVWQAHRDDYAFVADRSGDRLAFLYPPSYQGLSRLRVRRGGRDIGWGVFLRMDFRQGEPSPFFGRLAVGVVADGFAAPEEAYAVTAALVAHARDRDVDILISNQNHPAWGEALVRNGFFRGPSNFAFYCAPSLQASLGNLEAARPHLHLNRGDGDGPKWV